MKTQTTNQNLNLQCRLNQDLDGVPIPMVDTQMPEGRKLMTPQVPNTEIEGNNRHLECQHNVRSWEGSYDSSRDEEVWSKDTWDQLTRWTQMATVNATVNANGNCECKLATCELVIYSGHMEDTAPHSERVALMPNQEAQKSPH